MHSLVGLPVEVLENIASWLAPSIEEDSRATPNHDLDARNLDNPVRDCKSMRLTCKTFAHLYELKKFLFSTFPLYPEAGYFERFRSFSEHEELRPFLRHVTFMHPQFPDVYEIATYEKKLFERLVLRYNDKVEGDNEWTHQFGRDESFPDVPIMPDDLLEEPVDPALDDPDDVFMQCYGSPRTRWLAKKYMDTIISPEIRRKNHSEMIEAVKFQGLLFDHGVYVEEGGRMLSRFPNASSFMISGADESTGLGRCFALSWGTSMIKKRFPHWHLDELPQPDCQTSGELWSTRLHPFVLQLLAASNRSLTQFRTGQASFIGVQVKLPPSFAVERLNHLTTVDVDVVDNRPELMPSPQGPNFLLTMLTACSAKLRVLKLHLYFSPFTSIGGLMPSLRQVLQLTFPSLHHLEIPGGWEMDAFAFSHFMTRHPSLRTFLLPNLGRDTHPNEWWRVFYKALRDHSGLIEIDITQEFRDPDGFYVCVLRDPRYEEEYQRELWMKKPEWYRDVQAYVRRQGAWTQALKNEFA